MSSVDDKQLIGNVAMKIGVRVEPSEEFCRVAQALGFIRVVWCSNCRFQDTPDCKMKDDVEYKSFCSHGLSKDE